MSSWKDKITVQIQNREGLFILLDPQFVVSSDAKLQETLHNLGFEIILVNDTISFRYQLEKAKKDPMKLLSIWNEDKNKIPWDILSGCEKQETIINCSASKLFPKLSAKVVEQLVSSYYDELNDFYEKRVFNQHSEVDTIEFVLERIFGTRTKVIGNSKKSFSKRIHGECFTKDQITSGGFFKTHEIGFQKSVLRRYSPKQDLFKTHQIPIF